MNWQIYVLILMILLSGFFSGAEIALFSLSQAKVRSLLEKDEKNSKLLQRLKDQPQKLLITILIANNFINIGSSSLATVVAIEKLGSAGAGIATGVMTFLILFFGEIIPKSIAQRYAEQLSLKIAPLMRVIMFVLLPLVWLMNMLTLVVQKIFRIQEAQLGVSEDEVNALMNIGHEGGLFEKDEKEMIERVFLLNDIAAEDVMTPDEYMVSFATDTTIRESLQIIQESGFSRFPVQSKSSSEIEGILYIKDVFSLMAEHEAKQTETSPDHETIMEMKVSEIMKSAEFIPETMNVDDLMKHLQKKRKHIAIVVDEHGVTRGLVTLEDLLEEIVGEIIDETDVDETKIQRIDKNSIIIDPRVTIGKVNAFFNSELKGSRQKTIGWLALKSFGKIPQKGDSVMIDDYKFIVEEADDRRIKRLMMLKTTKSKAHPDNTQAST